MTSTPKGKNFDKIKHCLSDRASPDYDGHWHFCQRSFLAWLRTIKAGSKSWEFCHIFSPICHFFLLSLSSLSSLPFCTFCGHFLSLLHFLFTQCCSPVGPLFPWDGYFLWGYKFEGTFRWKMRFFSKDTFRAKFKRHIKGHFQGNTETSMDTSRDITRDTLSCTSSDTSRDRSLCFC